MGLLKIHVTNENSIKVQHMTKYVSKPLQCEVTVNYYKATWPGNHFHMKEPQGLTNHNISILYHSNFCTYLNLHFNEVLQL